MQCTDGGWKTDRGCASKIISHASLILVTMEIFVPRSAFAFFYLLVLLSLLILIFSCPCGCAPY